MTSFRDRFLTRRTAEAITAPSAIVAGGAAAAGAILAGAGPLAPVAAAAAYAGMVLWRMPRRRPTSDEVVDLRRLRDPWRWYVKEAQDARRRFDHAVRGAEAGPLRERLAVIGERVDDAVAECWRIARRGQELEDALGQLTPVPDLERRLADLDGVAPSSTEDRLRQALRNQLDTHARITRTASQARDRLQILEARLDEAVANAVELSLAAGMPAELGGLGDDVDSLVEEMTALRRGLDEAAGQASPG